MGGTIQHDTLVQSKVCQHTNPLTKKQPPHWFSTNCVMDVTPFINQIAPTGFAPISQSEIIVRHYKTTDLRGTCS